MENKERYLYYIFENKSPVYLKREGILEVIKDFPCFEINEGNQDSFIDALPVFLNDTNNAQKRFIIINTNNINIDNQKKLSYMIKDKEYQTLILPDNCKIIVTGNKDNLDKELYGLLVVVDV